jgi:hypothetical protein
MMGLPDLRAAEEATIFRPLITETMTDPGALRGCMSERTADGAAITKALNRIAKAVSATKSPHGVAALVATGCADDEARRWL